MLVSLLKDVLVGVTGAAGHDEHRGEDRQRHQRRPCPFRLCHRDDSADDRVFHFHNCVFLLLVLFCLFLRTTGSQNSFPAATAWLA
jgi:hypothetical protein